MRTVKRFIGFVALTLGFAYLIVLGGLVDGTATLAQIDMAILFSALNIVGGYLALRLEGAL